jgi:hypothetical protein
MIVFTPEMRSKLISMAGSHCLGRHSVFAVRQCREVSIRVTLRRINKHSSKVRLAWYKLTEDTCNT